MSLGRPDGIGNHQDCIVSGGIVAFASAGIVTMIVATDRLTTVTDADLILVMSEGRVVENGRHEALIAAGGIFAVMWDAQTNRCLCAYLHYGYFLRCFMSSSLGSTSRAFAILATTSSEAL